VALRSPRRGRVARRSPSIAIVGRRLLGRFLLGEGTSEQRGRGGQVRTLAFWESRSGVRDGVLDLHA
jgi:hypothetical protein